jgi:predicted MPP superfamily phosphohydrolase
VIAKVKVKMLKRYAVISDVHLENRTSEEREDLFNYLRFQSGDAIFVAGDVCPVIDEYYEEFFDSLSNFGRVFYVAGNHEFYGTSLGEGHKLIREKLSNFSNIVNLTEEGIYFYNSFKIVGSTLWYDYSPDVDLLKGQLNDFKFIGNTVDDFINLGVKQKQFLENVCNEDKYILLTHHLPFNKCLHPNYKGNKLNCYFVNDLGNTLIYLPHVAIHGHSHKVNSHYYVGGDCYVMSNPQPNTVVKLDWFNLDE